MSAVPYTGPVKNIVVVMFENRSYDNILGLLYDTANAPPYDVAPPGQRELDGLTRRESNLDAISGEQIGVWGGPDDATTIPALHPGGPFADVAQQLLGLADATPVINPYPLGPGVYGPMGGFVANYRARAPSAVPADVMHAFVPSSLPVTAYLANRFMVCDRWFASAPAETLANHLFAHCAAPGGVAIGGVPMASFIDDIDYMLSWSSGVLLQPNVFSRLDAVFGRRSSRSGTVLPNWKLYFHDYSITGSLLPYVARCYDDPDNANVANYDECDYPPGTRNPLKHPPTTFLQDVAQGTLAPYTFIEPRYSNSYPGAVPNLRANSNHPGRANYRFNRTPNDAVIDVIDGELLLLEIYLALRHSRYWEQTLLIVTYDEHGGIYDHVFPPAATAPGPAVRAAAGGFGFDVFGARVPAIIVSPYVTQGSIMRPPDGMPPFDHTSIIKTVWECFGLAADGIAHINARDAAAPSILPYLHETIVNTPGADPVEPLRV